MLFIEAPHLYDGVSNCFRMSSEVEAYGFFGKSVVSDDILLRQTREGLFS